MLNKLLAFIRKFHMLQSGDHVVCAVSGGADSVALLYAMHLLSEKLQITVSAAHFNHRLRGEESDRDEAFVVKFCQRNNIPLQVGTGDVVPGKKGLEAAARKARYDFLNALPGKIATAHTADDNAETVLLHLVRGTGLKGLGGITPVRGRVIRPMLGITRQEVLDFLREYSLSHIHDSSNDTDAFLRNRLRHHVMPLLHQENPRLSENLSAMALRLRQDEQLLSDLAKEHQTTDVRQLKQLPQSLRTRVLTCLLEDWGVPEPEAEHIALAEKLVLSQNPSASATFPGNVVLSRCYERLEKLGEAAPVEKHILSCPGQVELPLLGIRIVCRPAVQIVDKKDCFTVVPTGSIVVRARLSGDTMCCSGGTKSLKALFIDKKIPVARRSSVPVLADDGGILGVYGLGANKDRLAKVLPAVEICIEPI